VTSLAHEIATAVLPNKEVSRLEGLRRSTVLFSRAQQADSVYFIESGLVKLSRTNDNGERIILEICGAGYLIGEESLAQEAPVYYADAEVLSTASVARIPRQVLAGLLATQANLAYALVKYLVERRIALAEKVELLCLHGVEYRILFSLAQLSKLVKGDGSGYQLPITQLELADLIGATRETTSTTLNQLERRGLVRLSRRLLTIPSPELLLNAAREKMLHMPDKGM